jgi:hypothetical protein
VPTFHITMTVDTLVDSVGAVPPTHVTGMDVQVMVLAPAVTIRVIA